MCGRWWNAWCIPLCVYHTLYVTHSVCTSLHVYLTPCVPHSMYTPVCVFIHSIPHFVYTPLRVCIHSVCVSHSVYVSHSVCSSLRMYLTPCVAHSMCTSLCVYLTPCVPQSVYISTPYLTPCMYLTPCVPHSVCVSHSLYPTPYLSHSVCTPLRVYSTPCVLRTPLHVYIIKCALDDEMTMGWKCAMYKHPTYFVCMCVRYTFFVCKISCMCLQTKIILFSACRFGFTTNLILLRVLVRLPAGVSM